jgi:protein-arginine kinase activator protein McsA
MDMITAQEVTEHIKNKIAYHKELLKKCEESEEYEKCAYHRDEILRLQEMITT